LVGAGRFAEPCGPAIAQAGVESFIQVHRVQAEVLYQILAERARGARRAADLYCGLGAIAFHLAAAGIETVGVDRSADAEWAQRAAHDSGLPVSFVRADAGQAKLGLVDLVVVNPPRKGLSRAARAQVVGLGPERILYLSCGPESLGRDLAELTERGYRAVWAQPVDLMPGTAQIETIVELRR
ncbi:MAG: methyltransferase, partial [Deltaproteobacteria bacterium]|nr:methyltransferase [Deltaproteobacteria bacterium]